MLTRHPNAWIAPILLSLAGCATTTNPYLESAGKPHKQVHLPFVSGTRAKVSQGAFGKDSHAEPGNEYSWDFDVPLGTDVVSVEDGEVIEVWQPNQGGGCDRKYSAGAHNIKIRAVDGTVAQYVHVDALVVPWIRVKAGQVIARTANNGHLCRPQLHFGIYNSSEELYPSPRRKTVPVHFREIPGGIARSGQTVQANWPHSEFSGRWRTECTPLPKRHALIHSIEFFSNLYSVRTELFETADCQNPTVVVDMKGEFHAWPETHGHRFDQRVHTVDLTLVSSSAVEHYNRKAMCGLSGWRLNDPRDVSGRTCEPFTMPKRRASIHDFAKHVEGRMTFGGFPMPSTETVRFSRVK